jgi:hypothetical protein
MRAVRSTLALCSPSTKHLAALPCHLFLFSSYSCGWCSLLVNESATPIHRPIEAECILFHALVTFDFIAHFPDTFSLSFLEKPFSKDKIVGQLREYAAGLPSAPSGSAE